MTALDAIESLNRYDTFKRNIKMISYVYTTFSTFDTRYMESFRSKVVMENRLRYLLPTKRNIISFRTVSDFEIDT